MWDCDDDNDDDASEGGVWIFDANGVDDGLASDVLFHEARRLSLVMHANHRTPERDR